MNTECINTFKSEDVALLFDNVNEVNLEGVDENGEHFTIRFGSNEFIEWINYEQYKYIKEKLIKHIEKL